MVFISYSSMDKKIAYRTRDFLIHNDVQCWMAPDSIPIGSDYASSIPKAIKTCDFFLLILSKNAQESTWVIKELEMAISQNKNVIPLQIDHEDLNDKFTFTLTNVQRIEAYRDIETSYATMLSHIKAPHGEVSAKDIFRSLVEKLYQAVTDYRLGKSEKEMIDALYSMHDPVSDMDEFSVRYLSSHPKLSSRAKSIVDLYNSFANYFNKYISFPVEERRSAEARRYAQLADKNMALLTNKLTDALNYVNMDPNRLNAQKEFRRLLEAVYNKVTAFRLAESGSTEKTDALCSIEGPVFDMCKFSEIYLATQRDLSEMAKAIVDRYNLFVAYINKWKTFPTEEIESAEAQKCLKLINQSMDELVLMLKTMLSLDYPD